VEHWKELLLQAVSTILFCTAVVHLLHQTSSYEKLLVYIEQKYRDSDALYEVREYEPKEEIISYAEIIMMLCGTLEYDIEIDGRLISKVNHSIASIEEYSIKTGKYRKSYRYDEKGNLTRIVYEFTKVK